MKTQIAILLFSVIALTISCEPEETCGSNIYKGNLVDDLLIINSADTTNILIEQLYFYKYSLDSIPYLVSEKDSSDFLKLNLLVMRAIIKNQ